MKAKERIIVALDVDSLDKAKDLVMKLMNFVGYFKVGLELLTAEGAPKVMSMMNTLGAKIFFDGKFMDIPNTVAGAVREVTKLGVRMLNIHCLGGPKMMEEARKAVEEISQQIGAPRPLILGVTILTSLSYQDLVKMGIRKEFNYADPKEQAEVEKSHLEDLAIRHLAWLAQESGLDGIIASPQEIAAVRDYLQPETLVVTPGIRPPWAVVGDQKRIMTPKEAIVQGADYLVIGRPITTPPDNIGNPVYATKLIIQEIEEGLEERKKKGV